ncbi:Hypothetical protein A7982_07506 [Minicystis rosea]|nr:Hypothetical protein A7982_07506 [Minicystis rosea]
MLTRASLFVALFALTACGSSTATTTGGGGGNGGAPGTTSTGTGTGGASNTTTGTGGSELTGESFSVTFDAVTVQPGEESTRCVLKRLPNPDMFHAGKIHNVLGPGSHHLIVYKTADTEEKPEPYACQPFADLLTPEKGSPLMITQKKDDTLEMPAGVALKIEKTQMVRLEMHYINTTAAPLDVTATSTFYAMKESDVQNEADFLFVGSPDINVPPQGTQTLGPVYTPLTAELKGAKFFGFTGHEHHWGTGVTVAVTTGKTGSDQMVYDPPSWTWDEPPTVYHNPPVEVPDGGGFRFTCTYENKGTTTAKFGESANDEMCFFWTYYYPSKGAFVCAHTDQFLNGVDLCCPGSPFCSQLFK